MKPQCTLILSLLRKRPYTTGELWRSYGIGRPGSRIAELRQAGYDIRTALVPVPTRTGDVARVAQYTLVEASTHAA